MMNEDEVKRMIIEEYLFWKETKQKYLLEKITTLYLVLKKETLWISNKYCEHCGEYHSVFLDESIQKIEELIGR